MLLRAKDEANDLIRFNMQEEFTTPLITEHLTLTLITNGKATLQINGKTAPLMSQYMMLTSWKDKIVLTDKSEFAAKSFSFHPTLVNKSLTPENINSGRLRAIADRHDRCLLNPFLERNDGYNGIVRLLPQAYLYISKWFDLSYREFEQKNDAYRLYNIRRCLMQILFYLEDKYRNGFKFLSDESVISIVLEHIHSNYHNEISLDSLCKLACVNRTTLSRKFKQITRRPPIDYLLHHRLSIACDFLTHSKLSISKIAEATGFRYETYFIRQFTAKMGISPARYRQSDGYEALNNKESFIVEEF